MPKMVSKRIARAVVFDMDGTLTKPVLDFAEMRYALSRHQKEQFALMSAEKLTPQAA